MHIYRLTEVSTEIDGSHKCDVAVDIDDEDRYRFKALIKKADHELYSLSICDGTLNLYGESVELLEDKKLIEFKSGGKSSLQIFNFLTMGKGSISFAKAKMREFL